MKLVLLPGMDGTGILFEALLYELGDMDVASLPLPKDTSQDYDSLADYVIQKLPSENFILLAESFSGGIAAIISRKDIPQLKGIIFVASFLSAPKRLLARIFSCLPIGYIARMPLSGVVHRLFFLGWNSGNNKVSLFKQAINAVPNRVIQSRLKTIAKCHYDGFKSHTPAVYIRAINDKLVPIHMLENFKEAYPGISIIEIEGPHFILQSQPKVGAAAIIEAVYCLTNRDKAQSRPMG